MRPQVFALLAQAKSLFCNSVTDVTSTSGARTMSINFKANYVVSKRVTIGAYFDHQSNTPLVSNSAYPTTNSNYGLSVQMSLTK